MTYPADAETVRVDPAATRECDGYPGLVPYDEAEALGGAVVRVPLVTFEEALAEVEADEREAFVYLFGCCGDPGDCGTCGA